MVRIILIMTGTLVLGIIVGNQMAQNPQAPVLLVQSGASDVPGEPEAYQDMLAVKDAEIARLTDLNLDLQGTVEQYSEMIVESEGTADYAAELIETIDAVEETSPVEEESRARRPWGNRDGEDSAEQREQFVNRMRDGMVNRWTEEWEKAPPASKERITAISDLQQNLMDTSMAMRNAETDEERAALREELESTRAVLRETISTEQDAQLAQVARDAGINDDKAVAQFVKETRSVLSGPVFQSGGPGSFGSRGGRGGRGGR